MTKRPICRKSFPRKPVFLSRTRSSLIQGVLTLREDEKVFLGFPSAMNAGKKRANVIHHGDIDRFRSWDANFARLEELSTTVVMMVVIMMLRGEIRERERGREGEDRIFYFFFRSGSASLISHHSIFIFWWASCGFQKIQSFVVKIWISESFRPIGEVFIRSDTKFWKVDRRIGLKETLNRAEER